MIVVIVMPNETRHLRVLSSVRYELVTHCHTRTLVIPSYATLLKEFLHARRKRRL